jgi:hypothetical protein
VSKPGTTNAAFETYDSELNLDPRERNAAQHRHQQVTAVLVGAGLAVDTFLQGSFARKTMLKPLKDVDMVVLLPDALAQTLRVPGGPARAMALFAEALRPEFSGVRFDVDGEHDHALQVTFTDCAFTFDLVPAYEDPAGSEDVFIADRGDDRWERSNTRTLTRVIRERNQATGGRFVHQVRMLKGFKAGHPVLDETCGLLWESLANGSIHTTMSHQRAVEAALAHAAKALLGPVLDPTGKDDLTVEWTPSERAARQAAAARAADAAAEALLLEADHDHDAAIDVWHGIFGEPFPEAPPQSASDVLRNLAAGGVTSSGRAVASVSAREPARPSRAWRSR